MLRSSERAEKAFEDARKKESGKMAKLEALLGKKDELKDKPIRSPSGRWILTDHPPGCV